MAPLVPLTSVSFVFFGSDDFSVGVLLALERRGFLPTSVVTSPPRKKGRGLLPAFPPPKIWAQQRGIAVLQPDSLKEVISAVSGRSFGVFIVASYGKILPKEIFEIPKYGSLNVHPSLLPKWRGAAPIKSAILSGDTEFGVTVILMDEKMDQGPIIAQRKWEKRYEKEGLPKARELADKLAGLGGELLAEVIPKWIAGNITPVPQDENERTYTKKIRKEDGLLELAGNPLQNFRKIRAFDGWPGTYFFATHAGKNLRIVVKDADLVNNKLVITRVIPEGKREMSYEEFLRGAKNRESSGA